MGIRVVVSLFVLLFAGLSGRVAAQDEARPVATAYPRGDAPIDLDGRLDEPIWSQAPVFGGFVERSPSLGGRPPVETEFRVIYDADAIWVGVRCALPPGERPRGYELTRDSFRIFEDDVVTLKVDVHHDRRTTVAFAVNASGAQLDYLALEDGGFRREFDAVWDAEIALSADAWTIEFRIPVAALGLAPRDDANEERILGFEVTRDHNARAATYDWSLLPPEFGPVAATHYGELRGVRGIAGGRPFSAIPYVRYGWHEDATGDVGYDHGAGGDLRLRIARDVWGELTLFTDFAQVDLDDPAVNLDRFPLFLPEKRPFFLSGLDVFEFGATGQAQIFFSRRIGLDETGREVPVIAGLKAYGRTGRFRFGLLDVLTDDATTFAGETPAANFAIARARVDLGQSSYLGLISASRQWLTGERVSAHESFGADTRIRLFEERLELSGFAAMTLTEGEDTGGAASARAAYRGEAWRPAISTLWVSDEFQPEVGFVRRRGIFQHAASLSYVHRTDALGLETATVSADGTLRTDDESETSLGWNARAGLGAEWRSGWSAVASAQYRVDVVEEGFELFDGVAIAAGEYRGVEAHVEVSTPDTRNPSAWVYYGWNHAFFGGSYHNPAAGIGVSFGPHLRLATDADVYIIDIPGHDTLATIEYRATATVAASTRLFADLVYQMEEVTGRRQVDESATMLARIRWMYSPGSDVIFVWRTDFATAGAARVEHQATLKATYRWDGVL